MSKLEIKNISMAYDSDSGERAEILKEVSLVANDKEFISIVGPSGCGKTTLLKIISGLLKPLGGEIFLDDKAVKNNTNKIGFVFQHFVSFPWLTVKENVAFGIQRKIKNKNQINDIVQHYLNSVGLRGNENSFINELSGGMKQRVALATVLANDPEILLMDEPFSRLDTQTKGLMQELIISIWEESKKTVLFVTHDIEEAIFLSDKVYVMSAKPGIIKEKVSIDLPRPRTAEIKLSKEFFEIKKHITYLVRGEAIKAANVSLNKIRPKALKIGSHVWPGNSPFYLAREYGYYQKNNLDVEIIDLEKQESRIDSFVGDDIDLFVSTLDSAILAKNKIPDLKIIFMLNQSFGGDGLLVSSSISNIKELKGKKIAVEKEWVSHFFLLYLLHKNQMSSKDVEIIFLKGSDIGAALISGKVEAAVTFEPWLTQAKQLSGTKIIASTKDFPAIFDVLCVKEKVLQTKQAEIKKLIDIWDQSVQQFKKHFQESCEITAHYLVISNRELKKQLENLILFDIIKNQEFLCNKANKDNIEDVIKIVRNIWKVEGLLDKDFNVDNVVDSRFILK